jgi:hypothetical protein
MNEKKAKQLRREARITMSTSPNKSSDRTNGPTAYLKPMLVNGGKVNATFKQIKRAVWFATNLLDKKQPDWAKRLLHSRRLRQFVPVG